MSYLVEFVFKFLIELCLKIGINFYDDFLRILMMLPLTKNAKKDTKLISLNPRKVIEIVSTSN